MYSPTIENFEEGKLFEGKLLIAAKELRKSKKGDDYLYLLLRDRTGIIPTYVWDGFDPFLQEMRAGWLLDCKGKIQIYAGQLQMVVVRIHQVLPPPEDLSPYLPTSQKPPEEMFKELLRHLDTVKNPHIHQLLKLVFQDKTIREKFKKAPAAKLHHHAFLGGLLEHTLSMLRLVEHITACYPHLNRDLLIAGVCFHDLGKIDELSKEHYSDYSRKGRLLGHIAIGLLLVDEKIRKINDFPEALREKIHHMILAHHGSYEFGSPRKPKTREALVLHILDLLDSHLAGFDAALANQTEEMVFARIFNHFILNE